MRKRVLSLLAAGVLLLGLVGCGGRENVPAPAGSRPPAESAQAQPSPAPSAMPSAAPTAAPSPSPSPESAPAAEPVLEISAGGQAFLADLADTDAARALEDMLPITLRMADWQGVGKAFDLPSALPESPQEFSTVPAGALLLEGSGGLRLFCLEDGEGGSYTPLAVLRDPEGLSQALAGEFAEVTFQMAAK